MYGNGGGSAASTAGGTTTQPNAPKTNPVEVALQQEAMGLQLKQIEAQNRLANAQATKTIAEANKIAGVDTEGQELQNKWQEIENRIQTSRENIEQSNMKQAAANADKAVEDWKISVLEREYLDNVQEERVTLLVAEIAKIQKEGSLAESATDVNYHTARKIEKEVENFYYEMITRRMSAEAAKKSAENMLKKIENDYKLGSDQNLREWIYGGVDRINGILETIVKFKNGAQILEAIAKKIKK
jgi:predicted  nucleic acid-binding Zn-ribbon protein